MSSLTGVRHVRTRCPSTAITQSKHIPIPQYIPRGSPRLGVTRSLRCPAAKTAAATLSPANAVTTSPSTTIWTCLPRSTVPVSLRSLPAVKIVHLLVRQPVTVAGRGGYRWNPPNTLRGRWKLRSVASKFGASSEQRVAAPGDPSTGTSGWRPSRRHGYSTARPAVPGGAGPCHISADQRWSQLVMPGTLGVVGPCDAARLPCRGYLGQGK
jgi:hypothetical protein